MKYLSKSMGLLIAGLPLSVIAETTNTLPTLIVSATRTPQVMDESLASVTVITREDIERQQPNDMLDLLRQQAGIHISRNGGKGKSTNFYLRGTDSDHMLVLVDGVRAASATLGTFAWSNFTPEQIERIEIVYGPRTSLYGSDAIGGVIYITTRQAKTTNLSVTFGSNDSRALKFAHGGGDQWQYQISAGLEETDGLPIIFGSDTQRGWRNKNISAGLAGQLSDDLSLKLSGTHTEGVNKLDPSTGNSNFHNQVFSSQLDHHVNDTWSQKLTLGYAKDYSRSYSPTSPSAITTRRLSVSWQHDLEIGDNLLSLGVDHWTDKATKDDSGTINEIIGNTGVFAQYLIDLGDNDLQLSARHDKHDSFDEHNTWQFAWGRNLNRDTRVFAGYGTAFKAPTVNDLFWPYSNDTFFGTTYITQGNTNLKAETSRTAEVGLQKQFGANTKGKASLYHTRTKDLIEWTNTQTGPTEYTYTPSNVSKVQINGLSLELDTVVDNWLLRGSADFMSAKNKTTDKQLDRRPEASLRLHADRKFGLHEFGVDVEAIGRRNDRSASVRLGGYTLVDLRYSYPISKSLSLSGKVENLFDSHYVLASSFSGDYATPERSYFLTLSYQPD